ncbi:hypothetical protein ACFP3I_21910 [Chryseobacterium arachidis]|uniref:hypothetical protein n=1 Tax=Chryseobacterium arachidis TaxID=1416778 RepID=UPI0036086055
MLAHRQITSLKTLIIFGMAPSGQILVRYQMFEQKSITRIKHRSYLLEVRLLSTPVM